MVSNLKKVPSESHPNSVLTDRLDNHNRFLISQPRVKRKGEYP